MLKKIILLLVSLAFAVDEAWGWTANYYSAANISDPASCGASCYYDLSDYPYWTRNIRAWGNSAGAVNDATYVYLGKIGNYGYVATSSHTGSYTTDFSVSFHDGTIVAGTGRVNITTSSSYIGGDIFGTQGGTFPEGTWYFNAHGPRVFEIGPTQVAPGCTSAGQAASGADACCRGFDVGDGTCSAAGAGDACDGGCTNTVPPDMEMVHGIAPRDLDLNDQGSYAILQGRGARTASSPQIYLECNDSAARGGEASKDACCSTDSSAALGPDNTVTSDGTNQIYFGGSGTDCDTAAGYTYLGPAAESAAGSNGAWAFGLFGNFPMDAVGSAKAALRPRYHNSESSNIFNWWSNAHGAERWLSRAPKDWIYEVFGGSFGANANGKWSLYRDPLAYEQWVAGADVSTQTCSWRTRGPYFSRYPADVYPGSVWTAAMIAKLKDAMVPPVPRANSRATADCGFNTSPNGGDSGTNVFVKLDGVWHFAGILDNGIGAIAPGDSIVDYAWGIAATRHESGTLPAPISSGGF